mmetsp:Transcript_94757/g.141965  ORF Transcript_94757/g.141965 Transcript_94757/m.141965 type:complete len:692 (-) Transcript_94757:304-2379(-)
MDNGFDLQHASEELRAMKDVVIAAVSGNGRSLEFASDQLRGDKQVVLAAVLHDGRALQFAADNLRAHKDLVLAAVHQNPNALGFVAPELLDDFEVLFTAQNADHNDLLVDDTSSSTEKDDAPKIQSDWTDYDVILANASLEGKRATRNVPDFVRVDKESVLAAVQKNGYALKSVAEALKGDEDVVRTAFESKGSFVLIYASPNLKTSKPFMQSLALKSGHVLQYASESVRNDKHVVLTAVKTNGTSLQHASNTLRADKEVVLAAVSQDGKALPYASAELQEDADIFKVAVAQHGELLATAPTNITEDGGAVLAAVAQEPSAIIHASPSLMDDKEFVKQVVAKHAMALRFLSADFRADKDVVMSAVQHSGLALQHASEELRADKEIVLMAVSGNADALQYTTSMDLRTDKQIWMAMLAQNGNHLAEAPEKCRRDKACVLVAARSCHGSLKYALDGLNQDEDCLIAAGLWDEGYTQGAQMIVLSTRFSLSAESSATATEFTVLLKSHSYFLEEAGFTVYSPNAFNKSTCDPEWTRMDWPCRGTSSSCKIHDPALKSGIPKSESCWRYSYRYHLQKTKQQNGFMIQLIEIHEQNWVHEQNWMHNWMHVPGKGQLIESVMASEVGVKVFRIFEPGFRKSGEMEFNSRSHFRREDIDELAHHIRRWYQQNCQDMTECDVQCFRAYDSGPSSYYHFG